MKYSNKTIERYNELISNKNLTSNQIFDILLKEHSRKRTRKEKINNLFK